MRVDTQRAGGVIWGRPGQDAASLGDPQICAPIRPGQTDPARKFCPVRERSPNATDMRAMRDIAQECSQG